MIKPKTNKEKKIGTLSDSTKAIVLFTAISIIGITLLLTWLSHKNVQQKNIFYQQDISRTIILNIRQQLSKEILKFDSLLNYIDQTGNTNKENWRQFTRGWFQKQGLIALGWVPVIPHRNRHLWEQTNLHAPLPKEITLKKKKSMWNFGKNNKVILSSNQKEYYPLKFIIGDKRLNGTVGYEMRKSGVLAKTFAKARETNQLSVTDLFSVPYFIKEKSMMLVHPIWNRKFRERKIRGFLIGIFYPELFIESKFAGLDDIARVELYKNNAPNQILEILKRDNAEKNNQNIVSLKKTGIIIADSLWHLTVYTHNNIYYNGLPLLIIPTIGILLAILISLYLYRLLERRQKDKVIMEEKNHLLQEKERRFRHLAENSLDVVFRYRLQPISRFEYLSPSIETFTGYSANEFYKNHLLLKEIIHVDDYALLKNIKNPPGNNVPFIFRFSRKDGSIFWAELRFSISFDTDGNPIAIDGSARDITEKKLEEIALERKSDEIEKASSIGRIGSYHKDLVSKQLTCSSTFYNIFEIDDKVPLSLKRLHEHIHIDDVSVVIENQKKVFEMGKPGNTQYRIITNNGNERIVQDYSRGFFDEKGNLVSVSGIIQDVTEREKVNVQLREALDTARVADTAKNEFLAVMSHEMRTPLNGIVGFTYLLKKTKLNLEQKEYVNTIEKSGESLLHVIDDILDFSKLNTKKVTKELAYGNIRQFIQDTVSMLQAAASKKQIDFTGHVSSDIPAKIETDFFRLRQLLLNLLSNAIKFTDSGKVELKVLHTDTEKKYEKNKVELSFQVLDTGIGIEKNLLKDLFLPFNQGDSSLSRKYGGTGLGLAIVKKISEILDGEMTVKSELEKGTTFTFKAKFSFIETQASTQMTEQISKEMNTQKKSPLRKITQKKDITYNKSPRIKILVAEDEPMNQTLIKRILEHLGHLPTVAENGQQVLELMEQSYYDFIFMDLHMPILDGLETTKKIRANEKEKNLEPIIIVALTADALPGDREKCLKVGMNDYLSKPIDINKLKETIEKLVSVEKKEAVVLEK